MVDILVGILVGDVSALVILKEDRVVVLLTCLLFRAKKGASG